MLLKGLNLLDTIKKKNKFCSIEHESIICLILNISWGENSGHMHLQYAGGSSTVVATNKIHFVIKKLKFLEICAISKFLQWDLEKGHESHGNFLRVGEPGRGGIAAQRSTCHDCRREVSTSYRISQIRLHVPLGCPQCNCTGPQMGG